MARLGPSVFIRKNAWGKTIAKTNQSSTGPLLWEGARGKGITIPRLHCGQQKKAKAFRVLPFGKTSMGWFYYSPRQNLYRLVLPHLASGGKFRLARPLGLRSISLNL